MNRRMQPLGLTARAETAAAPVDRGRRLSASAAAAIAPRAGAARRLLRSGTTGKASRLLSGAAR